MTNALPAEALDATFQRLRRVMTATRVRFQAALAAHDMTLPQLLALKALRSHGRMTLRELADALDVTPGNVTGIVDRLERDGLVTRTRSPKDRRVVHARLTDAGFDRLDEIRGLAHRVLGELFAGWSTEDLDTLRGLLERVALAPGEGEPPF